MSRRINSFLQIEYGIRLTSWPCHGWNTGGARLPGAGPDLGPFFDSDAVTREKWTSTPPSVDIAEGIFLQRQHPGSTGCEIQNKYQTTPMSGTALQATVERYNSFFVDAGKDSDFAKPAPTHKIQTAPFYAAWATPVVHDTRTACV